MLAPMPTMHSLLHSLLHHSHTPVPYPSQRNPGVRVRVPGWGSTETIESVDANAKKLDWLNNYKIPEDVSVSRCPTPALSLTLTLDPVTLTKHPNYLNLHQNLHPPLIHHPHHHRSSRWRTSSQ